MTSDSKLRIGKYEYNLCKDKQEKVYLYRYDVDYGIGIKIKFNDEDNNLKETLTNILKKQYIDRILMSKG